MHAVDTNVLVRLLIGDDKAQARRAVALFTSEAIYIPKSVILETEWVLRRLYKQAPEAVVTALQKLTGLPDVTVEDARVVNQALLWCAEGMDFADALHLASSGVSERFATFDARLKKFAPAELKPMILAL